MKWTMSTEDMETMLNAITKEGDTLSCMIWAVIMMSKKKLLLSPFAFRSGPVGAGLAGARGALSNTYCYIGCGKEDIYIACLSEPGTISLDKLDASQMKHAIIIPVNTITKVKKCVQIIPGRRVVKLYTGEGNRLIISVMNNAIFSNIKEQKKNADRFFEILFIIGNNK